LSPLPHRTRLLCRSFSSLNLKICCTHCLHILSTRACMCVNAHVATYVYMCFHVMKTHVVSMHERACVLVCECVYMYPVNMCVVWTHLYVGGCLYMTMYMSVCVCEDMHIFLPSDQKLSEGRSWVVLIPVFPNLARCLPSP
jgi:hypothetical protein